MTLTDSQVYLHRVEKRLDEALTNTKAPKTLIDSMRYSTLAGGKRIRALLVYASGIITGAKLEALDTIAAAIECIHAYSLIHDDLPAMDDDELRRGKPTNHIKFGEATAILAGDALQTLAFELILSMESDLRDYQVRLIGLEIAKASGAAGMVGGQMLDIEATNKVLERAQLERVHRCKTGALILAATRAGALAGDLNNKEQISALELYAANIGLAFQVIDDILDIESSTEILGKPSGSDLELKKSTYPALLGLQESKQLAENLYLQAMDCVSTIGDNTDQTQGSGLSMLNAIAELIIKRTH